LGREAGGKPSELADEGQTTDASGGKTEEKEKSGERCRYHRAESFDACLIAVRFFEDEETSKKGCRVGDLPEAAGQICGLIDERAKKAKGLETEDISAKPRSPKEGKKRERSAAQPVFPRLATARGRGGISNGKDKKAGRRRGRKGKNNNDN